jgi:hypothetical protein
VRNVLLHNDLLYVIEEPLAGAPGPNATTQDHNEYREAHDIAIEVQTLMSSSMEPCLKAYYQHRDPYSMINTLRGLFAPQVRKQKFDCLNEFFTTKMEENTCIESHLNNMHRLYRHLIDELDYVMTNDIGKDVVLLLLPSSYTSYVEGYLMARFNLSFHYCLMQLKSLKVEPVAREILDPAGIFYIQCYKCFINTYAVLSI